MGTQHPLQRKVGHNPQFSAHVYCGQTVAYLRYFCALVFSVVPLMDCYRVDDIRRQKQIVGPSPVSVNTVVSRCIYISFSPPQPVGIYVDPRGFLLSLGGRSDALV